MDRPAAVVKAGQDRPSRVRLIPAGLMSHRVQAIEKKIADRAFEIFCGRCQEQDDALGDWFRAERDLFHAAHIDIRDAGEFLLVRAEVPGFSSRDLLICIEPRRLVITGKRAREDVQDARKVIYSDRCLDHIFRVFGLPLDVDTSKATAALGNGILELAIPITRGTGKSLLPNTDWLVRADD